MEDFVLKFWVDTFLVWTRVAAVVLRVTTSGMTLFHLLVSIVRRPSLHNVAPTSHFNSISKRFGSDHRLCSANCKRCFYRSNLHHMDEPKAKQCGDESISLNGPPQLRLTIDRFRCRSRVKCSTATVTLAISDKTLTTSHKLSQTNSKVKLSLFGEPRNAMLVTNKRFL